MWTEALASTVNPSLLPERASIKQALSGTGTGAASRLASFKLRDTHVPFPSLPSANRTVRRRCMHVMPEFQEWLAMHAHDAERGCPCTAPAHSDDLDPEPSWFLPSLHENLCFLGSIASFLASRTQLDLSISTDLARTSLLTTPVTRSGSSSPPHHSRSDHSIRSKRARAQSERTPKPTTAAKGKQVMTALALLCVVLLAATAVDVTAAASCNPSALSACAGALFGGAVTPRCCASLKAQQPCLCQYKRDPAYRGYVNGPVAQSVTRTCGLPMMKC